MSEVYVITNTINNKQYVGKTNRDATSRLKEHFRESTLGRSKNRPLYRAISKYGIDNFTLEVIGRGLTPQEASDLEVAKIKELQTFETGYNATIGGDGKTYRLTSEEEVINIVSLYNSGLSIKDIANILDADPQTISNRLKENGVRVKKSAEYKVDNSFYLFVNPKTQVTFNGSGDDFTDFLLSNKIPSTNNRESVKRGVLRLLDKTRKSYLGFKIIE